MPGGIWEALDEEEVRLKRPVLPRDWERPLIYSRRVRHFKYQLLSYCSYPDDAAFYEMLRMCWPLESLFPNIESLVWETSDAAVVPHFRLFIGPRLTSLAISTFQSASHLSLLPALATQCPLLQELSILTSDGLPGCCETVSLLVKHLTRLESLEVPCLDAVALDHLAKRPDQTPLSPTELSLTVTDARAATEVLARLTIQFPKNTSANAVREIYNGVVANCNEASLNSLSITLPMGTSDTAADPEQIALYAVPGRHLLPLFTLTTLTWVTLAAPVGLDLDDTGAAEIARAWPRIIAFLHIAPRTTLRALLAFARLCPNLWRLSLPINARSTAAEARPTQRSLTFLNVGESPMDTPLEVAAYLSSIFPKLGRVSAGKQKERRDEPVSAEVLACQSKWKAVEAALPLLRKVRAEEKYWTQREYEEDGSD
ncbi:hypothetical protein B0H12DRAFT_1145144 [Mycena haematopus]|nr:hypothetical protein B0H12DRAFT_1145144 [Mycena haematopus]